MSSVNIFRYRPQYMKADQFHRIAEDLRLDGELARVPMRVDVSSRIVLDGLHRTTRKQDRADDLFLGIVGISQKRAEISAKR